MSKYDQNILRELKNKFYYMDGKIYLKRNNTEVGWIDKTKNNRYLIGHNKRYIPRSRLVYMLCYDCVIPRNVTIDHKNQNKQDDRIENLRLCDISQNNRNVFFNKKNKIGFKGVKYSANGEKFISMLQHNKKSIYCGTFDNVVDAARAYVKASLEYHKEYSIFHPINIETFINHANNVDNSILHEDLVDIMKNLNIQNYNQSPIFLGLLL